MDGIINETQFNRDVATGAVIKEVKEERVRQFAKWGEQNHKIAKWFLILGEEVGEANEAALEALALQEHTGSDELKDWSDKIRTELIQVAAVAISIVEAYDRMPRTEIIKD